MTKMKILRKNKGFTLLELAKLVNVYPSTILNYESGKRLPDIEVGQKIAAALGSSPEEIWPVESSVSR